MTFVLEMEPEMARYVEEQAAQRSEAPQEFVLQVLAEKIAAERRAHLMKMADELFEDRASAYEALAEGAK